MVLAWEGEKNESLFVCAALHCFVRQALNEVIGGI